MEEEQLALIRKFADSHLDKNKDSAHNMDHVLRVYNLALRLAEGENVNMDVIKIAVLLHDIGGVAEIKDSKTDHAMVSSELAKPFLRELGLRKDMINHVLSCIITHRYRSDRKPETREAMIVFDADKLETVGAIGIARMFVWIGKHNGHIYRKENLEKYANDNLGGKINGKIIDKSKHSPQLNFETKDKYIVDYLFTEKAKEIAKERLKFYQMFLGKLEREIKGLE